MRENKNDGLVRRVNEERGLIRLDRAIAELDRQLHEEDINDDLVAIARATGVYRETSKR